MRGRVATSLHCALLALLAPLALAPLARAQEHPEQVPTERHYEILEQGKKVGYSRVTWAPSTWEGRRTVHDSTTIVRRSVRNMGGHRDRFETVTSIELERAPEGWLWWQKVAVEEGGQRLEEELTWTGAGYRHVTRVDAREQVVAIPLPDPVATDAEAFLSQRARRGELEPGLRLELRHLDVRARAAEVTELIVVGRDEVAGVTSAVPCWRVRERDPRSGAESLLWIDDAGGFVQLRTDSGAVLRQVSREKAEEMPLRPAEYSVTTPASPRLPRLFTAERLGVEVHLQGDPDRRLPELPESPWSRPLAVDGDDQRGWRIEVELRAHDDPAARAALPLDPAGFEADLEPTTLMPSDHPELVATARQVVGDAPDAREAVRRLARFVFEGLAKQSPAVANATALQILRERQGDCSEHAVLFVALCRAAGIPARRCTGWVCVGTMWGAHAWAEVWTGRWIGADPTTGEVGTAARYLFFGYPDRPDSHPGVISGRISGRMRLVTTAVAEGGLVFDLRRTDLHRLVDAESGDYLHVLAGVELRGVPEDWKVRLSGEGRVAVDAPGLEVSLEVMPDQGYTLDAFGGRNAVFAGAPAHRAGEGDGFQLWVHSRRRFVRLAVRAWTPESLARLEQLLRPTLGDRGALFGPPGDPRAPVAATGDLVEPADTPAPVPAGPERD